MGLRKIFDDDHSDWEHPQMISWSPDGQWISFIAGPYPPAPYPSKGRDEIYLARPDGSEIRRLTHTPGYKGANSWSPDGKSIVYSQTVDSVSGKTDANLFEVEVQTGRIRQITNTPDVYEYFPVYSPLGDAIVFASMRSSGLFHIFQLMIMDRDGSDTRKLIDLPIDVGGIAWSPDGAQIAFISSSNSSDKCAGDLYIINRDGSDLRHLISNPGSIISLSWSHDSQWILFDTSDICEGGALWKISLIKTDNSELKEVNTSYSLHFNPNQPPDPAWFPLPALQTGRKFIITESGAQLKLRASPSLTGEVLKKLDEYEQIFVLEGPKEADEYLWWRVRVGSSGEEGWVAENPGWFAGVEP